jgi:hypothetical protein
MARFAASLLAGTGDDRSVCPPSPSAAAAWLLCGLMSSACGRLGFEAQRDPSTLDPHEGGADPGDGDGDDSPGDGDGDGDAPLRDGGDGDGDGDADGGFTTADAGGLLPMNDGGMPDPDEDGGTGTLFGPGGTALPRAIDCASYAGALACDNFEGGTSGASVTATEESGTVTFDTGYITSTTTGPTNRAVMETRFSAFTSGAVYLRFSLYVPSSVVFKGLNIASIGDIDDFMDFGIDLDLDTSSTVELYVSGDTSQHSAAFVMPRDRWTCVLLAVESIDGTNGHARVVVDDQQVLDVTNIDTLPPSGVRGAGAGIDWTYTGQMDTTLHLKNFLVTRSPPGSCP